MGYTPLDLEAQRSQYQGAHPKNPFPHQRDAFTALSRTYTYQNEIGRSALLVLPTGAGKTFTATKWLCDHHLTRGGKILWLAHSFHLLDQAHEAFVENASYIPGTRNTINLRTVSSNPSHANSGSILPTDDILIATTQTAIRAMNSSALDAAGRTMISPFQHFLNACHGSRLFVVLDEAHHAPAYGCRHLLQAIEQLIPNRYLLGLTATPTYTDVSRRGWLAKLFSEGIIYEAKQQELIAQNILAAPKFIERPTGCLYDLDHSTYERIVREHQDLPEEIINRLAQDQPRNNFIIDEYLSHREQYGKTIIFVDRWFQCEYYKEKLRKQGITADAVYSHIDADPGSADARRCRTLDENKRVLERFKSKDTADPLQVLLNVRMLTEGTDVPDVQSVFITRPTTSAILLTQMIGRALRGKRAGGGEQKSFANVVFFHDEWKQVINWATPELDGGTDDSQPKVRGTYPMEYISVHLIQRLIAQMENGQDADPMPFKAYLPIGWYETQIVSKVGETDETDIFTEYVMVYSNSINAYERFIDGLLNTIPEDWSHEDYALLPIQRDVARWMAQYFEPSQDIANMLHDDVVRIARHIAYHGTKPKFHYFAEREQYDMDMLAKELVTLNPIEQFPRLQKEYNAPNSLWQTFYRSYARFKDAFDHAMNRLVAQRNGIMPPAGIDIPIQLTPSEPSDEDKQRVLTRDKHTCLACGAHGNKVRLEVDHIIPVAYGGQPTIDNLQTLCSFCNKLKGVNTIDFTKCETALAEPKEFTGTPRNGQENVTRSLARLINFFYHCGAVKSAWSTEADTLRVKLNEGNNPEWLLTHKELLLQHINTELRCPDICRVVINKINDNKDHNLTNQNNGRLNWPKQRKRIRKLLEECISYADDDICLFEYAEDRYLDFYPGAWKNSDLLEAGLFFSFQILPSMLELSLILGNGQKSLRQQYLDIALAHQPLFNCRDEPLRTASCNWWNNKLYKRSFATYDL